MESRKGAVVLAESPIVESRERPRESILASEGRKILSRNTNRSSRIGGQHHHVEVFSVYFLGPGEQEML